MRTLLLTALVLAFPVSVSAAAPSVPCTPGGPQCRAWTGQVTFVADGDTLDVDVAGDGTRRPVRVRVTGVQAMEQTVYSRDPARRRGDCHALEATARLERLVRRAGGRVRLAAQDPTSRSRDRLRRSVAVRTRRGWRDVGHVLLGEGLALWLPNKVEWAWNSAHRRSSQAAARGGRGLFDTDACGAGPEGRPSLALNWDAAGNDGHNVNGEWIRIANPNPVRPMEIAGWWVRDSYLRRYEFPRGTVVPAGGSIRVRIGAGESMGGELFWGLAEPAFENAAGDGRSMGDGAYLFDPQGDLRAWVIYPG